MTEQSITSTMVRTSGHGNSAELSLEETLVEGHHPLAPKGPGSLGRGTMVGRYIVLDMLGRGGMGIVYAAYDPDLDRKLALKLILPGHDDGVAARLRLQREAQAIAQLSHPNVVAVHDVGAFDDQVFIAMEFVEGMDLARWLTAQSRSQAEILELFRQAGKGLVAAHMAGLVHRDFKPENVLVGVDGRARVVDFGLVRRDESAVSRDPGHSGPAFAGISQRTRATDQLQLTDVGTMVGTPAYMSPEQFSGLAGDPRADQFSFCVSLYEALYGERPFDGENTAEVSYSVTQGNVRAPPAKNDVSGRLRRVLLRGLAVEPDDRYPGMAALLAALRTATTPRRWMWIAPAVVLMGGAGAVAAWGGDDPHPCASAGERAQVLWSPTRKETVDRAFRETDRPFAEDTWLRVDERIDRYLERWDALQQQVCQENADKSPQTLAADPRQQCLDDRFAEISDLLLVFEQANARTVTNAVQTVNRLSSLERCARFDSVDNFPNPSEPQMREQVREIRSELRRWKMLSTGGHDEATDQTLEDLVGRAEALDYPPLMAEVIEAQSGRATEGGRLDEAVRLSNLAFETALGSRHDFYAFQAAVGLTFLHGVQRREPTLAHRWARRAEALRHRSGDDPRLHVQVLSNEASVYALDGEEEHARALYDEALAVVREQLDDPVLLATLLGNIGAFHAEQRRLAVARDYMEEAIDINRDMLGPDHPTVLRTLANLGIVTMFSGDTEEGLEILEAVLPRQEVVFGESNLETANTLESMASALGRLERVERAVALRHRVIEIREAAYGPHNQRVYSSRINLASTLLDAGDLQPARDLLAGVLSDIESQPDISPRLHANTLINLARAELRLAKVEPEERSHVEGGLLHADAALALCQSTKTCPDADMPSMLVTVGWARYLSDDLKGARELFSEVLRLPSPEHNRWVHPQARFRLAKATVELDPERAITYARRALAELEGTDRISKEMAEDIRSWLKEHEPTRGPNAGG